MKIVSFNVNGIRAILQKNFKEDFAMLNADVFSLNETNSGFGKSGVML